MNKKLRSESRMGGDRRGKKKEHKKRERQTNGDWWTVRQKINAQNRLKKNL